MKSFGTYLAATLAIGLLALSGDAFACNGGGGGGGYVRGGNYGNPNLVGGPSCNANGGGYYANGNGGNYGQAYEPFHSTYFVQPGDTFYEIALKEYGTS